MELGIPYYAIVTKVAGHLTAFCDIVWQQFPSHGHPNAADEVW